MAEMMMKTNLFDINFQKGTFKARDEVEIVQYDNKTNLFVFNIEDEVDIGNSLLLKIKNYEGKEFEYPLTIKDNKAQILITNNVTYIAGAMKMSVSLISTDNRILTSVEIIDNIPIIEAIEGELPPEEEVNALIQIISENNELKQELQELIADHIRRLNNKEYNGAEVQIKSVDGYIKWKYVNEEETEWRNVVALSELIGPKGDTGESAYESAVKGGYTETIEDFYESLATIGYVNSVLDEVNGEVV